MPSRGLAQSRRAGAGGAETATPGPGPGPGMQARELLSGRGCGAHEASTPGTLYIRAGHAFTSAPGTPLPPRRARLYIRAGHASRRGPGAIIDTVIL